MSNWRDIIYSYPCITCGAKPGASCRTRAGNIADVPHAKRAEVAARCPVCNLKLPEGAEPGDLCDKHELIRSLELERTHTHPRTT
jgi:hypothetical protein